MGYYGFINDNKGGYSLAVEFGTITDSPYDHTESISKQYGLSKQDINEIIQADTVGTQFFYQGTSITKLY